MEKHPHAELIKQVVDGLAVPQANRAYGWWDGDLKTLVEHPEWEWRAKPAEPEKVYPGTQMSGQELFIVYNTHPSNAYSAMQAAANAALRHAVDNGYLVLPEGDKRNDERDLTIARAVAKHCYGEVDGARVPYIEIARIIESVKP